MKSTKIHAIIPAGGAGKRLWPLSTERFPKFLLPLSHSGEPLIVDTISRIESMSASISIVTGRSQADTVAGVVDKYYPGAYAMIEEPSGKNSMPAIGLAALLIDRRYGESIVASFAADHIITDEIKFREALGTAIKCAQDGYLVTLGITPDRPSTSFGYIEREPEVPTIDVGDVHVTTGSVDGDIQKTIVEKPWYVARRFHEKPSERLAEEYIRTERFYWNAGIFVCSTKRMIEFMRIYQPRLLEQLTTIADVWSNADGLQVCDQVWDDIEPISIDHALAEPLSREGYIAVVPTGDIGWSDVGTYDALADVHCDDQVNCVVNIGDEDCAAEVADDGAVFGSRVAGDGAVSGSRVAGDGVTLFEDCKNLTVIRHDDGNDRLVLAGLDDVVIVRTADLTLVTTREYSAKIPDLIDKFEA